MTAQAAPAGIQTWDEVSEDVDYQALVIGNGVSINIWSAFAYPSLFEQANLTGDVEQLFDRLGTTNFELVLGRLLEAREVLDALQYETQWIDPLYDEARGALFDAIREVHIPFGALTEQVKADYAAAMDDCASVFVLNYDLVAYWSHMARVHETQMVDFMFDGGHFDPANTAVWGGSTEILYPHGGLHLWQDIRTGIAGKYRNELGNILQQAEDGLTASGKRMPLLVSGGSADEKMSLIQQSALLSFAYQRLVDNCVPTAIIGASLGETDWHIAKAVGMNMAGSSVAIGIHVGSMTEDELEAEKGRFRAALRGDGRVDRVERRDIHFFDASTHPLCAAAMHCA